MGISKLVIMQMTLVKISGQRKVKQKPLNMGKELIRRRKIWREKKK